jgi:hypothetical protein
VAPAPPSNSRMIIAGGRGSHPTGTECRNIFGERVLNLDVNKFIRSVIFFF